MLHVTQPGSEGVANYIVDMCAALVDEYDIRVAGPGGSDLSAALAPLPVGFHRWDAARNPFKGLVTDSRRLARIIAEVRPDVLHLHSSKAGAVGRLLVRGRVPTVLQPHAWSFLSVGSAMAAAALAWERSAARWTHALVAVSSDERDVAISSGIRGIGHVEVIANPVDTARFRPRTDAERNADAVAPLIAALAAASSDPPVVSTHRPVVACVGRLCHQKGQDVLLSSVWPKIRARVPGAVLVLIGDGPSRADLESGSHGSVVFLGNRTDVAELWPDVDLAVFPSRWEGMSLAMLEAMASEVAIVASDAGGVAETIGRGAGAVVPLHDVDGWVEAIVARLNDEALRSAEGRRGRELAVTAHAPGAVAERLSGLYRLLLGDVAGTDLIRSDSRVASL